MVLPQTVLLDIDRIRIYISVILNGQSPEYIGLLKYHLPASFQYPENKVIAFSGQNTFHKCITIGKDIRFYPDSHISAFLKNKCLKIPSKFQIIITYSYPQHLFSLPLYTAQFPLIVPALNVLKHISAFLVYVRQITVAKHNIITLVHFLIHTELSA